MLSNDAQECQKSLAEQTLQQSVVDDHFKVARPEDKPAPNTDKLFHEAAIEWLIGTIRYDYYSFVLDCTTTYSIYQLIQALEHPKFKKMIDVAACATRGVKHLSQKQT